MPALRHPGRGALAVAALGALLTLACTARAAQETSGDVPAPETTVAVALRELAFNPAELQVAPGTTVVWTNEDPFQHSVTSDDGLFDSGLLDQGTSFTFTFTEPGRHQYYCVPHGGPGLAGMAGVIVVGEASPAESPPPAEQPPAEPVPSYGY